MINGQRTSHGFLIKKQKKYSQVAQKLIALDTESQRTRKASSSLDSKNILSVLFPAAKT